MDSQLNTLIVAGLIDDRIQRAADARRVRDLKHPPSESPRKRRWFPRPGFARVAGT